MTVAVIDTPLGRLRLTEEKGRLCWVEFTDETCAMPSDMPLLREAARQVNAYFSGELHAFSLPIALKGTAFEREALCAAAMIPYGQTCSYGELARRIKKTGAARAIGRAMANNPLLLVIPCHRVVASDGRLTGYRGGIERKRALLAMENENR